LTEHVYVRTQFPGVASSFGEVCLLSFYWKFSVVLVGTTESYVYYSLYTSPSHWI